jgi:hypothetical protein
MWLTVLLLYNDKQIYFEPQGTEVQSEGKKFYFKCFSEEKAVKL